jgi:hypothetical protein
MNPKTINDARAVVWTSSVEIANTYCLYIDGVLVLNSLPLDEFYPLLRRAIDGVKNMA